ncbi:MAG: hypothetical protein H7061_13925 [Bdellovibrionaceae bacterium]|nr:hypothetical protein [Bdellovibrio sp.]
MKPRFNQLTVLKNKSGQILVEYLLLMVIAIGCATLLTKGLVGRGEGKSEGMLIRQWDKIIHVIGNDIPDCSTQVDFNSAKCP